jgi:hypothetical protein
MATVKMTIFAVQRDFQKSEKYYFRTWYGALSPTN